MSLHEGERIKVFPDTDVHQYGRWINTQGFNFKRSGDYLIVLSNKTPRYDRKLFAHIFKHRLKLKNISREEISKKLEVTEYTVWTWEIGRFMPRKYNLDKLMNLLDITERDLERCRI